MTRPPLVVDLDGTLTPTDTLLECLVKLLKVSPFSLFLLPFWLLRGRAAFKAAVCRRTGIDAHTLPYREPLLAWLREEKQEGRRILLATAAHAETAREVAGHLGLFEQVLASDGTLNLKGLAKLEAIRAHLGTDFVYAGDSAADVPIWKAARGAVLVGVSSRTAQALRRQFAVEREFLSPAPGLKVWLQALRVHQWLKNLLLFVPPLTAFSFMQPGTWGVMLTAFFSFSLAASSSYIANDLWDLDNDRAHPRKRRRPFASARLSITAGLAVASVALIGALALALAISPAFLTMLLAYLVLTTAYSLWLKTRVLVDVLTLSMLYTLRILAGAVALGIVTTTWLLAFSVFIFFSLALVKRCSELVTLGQIGREASPGRDYRVGDLAVLWPLGVSAAMAAVVVLGLFISIPDTQARYASPALLWLAAMGLTYWLARLWIKTARGEMHDDPLIYALRDIASRATILLMVAVVLVAHFVDIPWHL